MSGVGPVCAGKMPALKFMSDSFTAGKQPDMNRLGSG